MGTKWPLSMALPLATAALCVVAVLGAPRAEADIGIEKVSRPAGAPGETVTMTLGCGACYPPCKGAEGHRHRQGFDHGPCMLGTGGKRPPASFGVSLVPVAKAPGPPFAFLGSATPPPGGNDPANGIPRYALGFEVPELRPGLYMFVVHCDFCLDGPGGRLIAAPSSPAWRFRVRAEPQGATRWMNSVLNVISSLSFSSLFAIGTPPSMR